MTLWPLHDHCRVPEAFYLNEYHISFQILFFISHRPQMMTTWTVSYYMLFSRKGSPIKSCRRFHFFVSIFFFFFFQIETSIEYQLDLQLIENLIWLLVSKMQPKHIRLGISSGRKRLEIWLKAKWCHWK